jgi:hypothetical protein
LEWGEQYLININNNRYMHHSIFFENISIKKGIFDFNVQVLSMNFEGYFAIGFVDNNKLAGNIKISI